MESWIPFIIYQFDKNAFNTGYFQIISEIWINNKFYIRILKKSEIDTHLKIKPSGKRGKNSLLPPTFSTFHYHPHRYRAFRQGKINFNDTWTYTEIPTTWV